MSSGSSSSRMPSFISPVLFESAMSGGSTKSRAGGYTAYVGKKKKPISTPSTTYNQAFNEGARYTDATPDARFTIVKTATAPKEKPITDEINPIFKERFRRTKKPIPATYVEKEKYRINSPGELKGITAKGIAANQFKVSIDLNRSKTKSLKGIKEFLK
jgi:hypothetical protein